MPSEMANPSSENVDNIEKERPIRRGSRKISAFLASAWEMRGDGDTKKESLISGLIINEGLERDRGDLIDTLQKHIEHNWIDTKENIKAAFDELTAVLNERRTELLQEADYDREKRLNILMGERRTVASNVVDRQLPHLRSIEPKHPYGVSGGTLRFSYDKSIIDNLKSIGKIDTNKASALHSKAEGLGLKFAFTNEEAQFEVVTRDQCMRESFLEEDSVRVEIEDATDERYSANVRPLHAATHHVTYTAMHPGSHKIHILVNNLEIVGSPFTVTIFDKENMTFDPETYLTSGNLLQSKNAYIVNKGATEAILTEDAASGAIIFGVTPFSTGQHAWKVKFTSACPSLHTSVGVSSRSNVFEVDMEHTCDFEMNNATYVKPRRTKHAARKMSSFRRTSHSYMVILDSEAKLLTILCCESNESKTVKVPDQFDILYPCVYMTHDCDRGLHCPRPIVAFV